MTVYIVQDKDGEKLRAYYSSAKARADYESCRGHMYAVSVRGGMPMIEYARELRERMIAGAVERPNDTRGVLENARHGCFDNVFPDVNYPGMLRGIKELNLQLIDMRITLERLLEKYRPAWEALAQGLGSDELRERGYSEESISSILKGLDQAGTHAGITQTELEGLEDTSEVKPGGANY